MGEPETNLPTSQRELTLASLNQPEQPCRALGRWASRGAAQPGRAPEQFALLVAAHDIASKAAAEVHRRPGLVGNDKPLRQGRREYIDRRAVPSNLGGEFIISKLEHDAFTLFASSTCHSLRTFTESYKDRHFLLTQSQQTALFTTHKQPVRPQTCSSSPPHFPSCRCQALLSDGMSLKTFPCFPLIVRTLMDG